MRLAYVYDKEEWRWQSKSSTNGCSQIMVFEAVDFPCEVRLHVFGLEGEQGL